MHLPQRHRGAPLRPKHEAFTTAGQAQGQHGRLSQEGTEADPVHGPVRDVGGALPAARAKKAAGVGKQDVGRRPDGGLRLCLCRLASGSMNQGDSVARLHRLLSAQRPCGMTSGLRGMNNSNSF